VSAQKGVMHNGLVVAYQEANEIGELLVRDALYVEEDLDVTPLDLRYALNVNLAGPDSQRLNFNIEVRGPGRLPSPPSPWFEQEGKLLDGEDPFIVVTRNSLWGHAVQQAKIVRSLCLPATDFLVCAVWAVLVEDNGRWLHRGLRTPTSNPLQHRTDRLVHGPKLDSVALIVKRYKTPCSLSLTMKLFEYVAGNRQIEQLFFFRTIGPNNDGRLICGVIPTLTNDPQGIAIRCHIRALEFGFREDIDARGIGPVVVRADRHTCTLEPGQICRPIGAGTLFENPCIIVRRSAIGGAMEKECFAGTVRIRAHDIGLDSPSVDSSRHLMLPPISVLSILVNQAYLSYKTRMGLAPGKGRMRFVEADEQCFDHLILSG
jgi:hypothetical protein